MIVVTSPLKQSLSDIFKNQKILITGHTGFKGSWLALWLCELGATVTGFSLAPEYPNSHFELLKLKKHINHFEGDLRDSEALSQCIKETNPEYIFHLAAQAIVRRSYEDPKATFEINISGGINLLEAVKKTSSTKALVYITSDKVYHNQEWPWGYRENDQLGGHDPYSASKAAAEIVVSSYLNSFFMDRNNFGGATTRAGNVIGGGDWANDRIIPDCIRALKANTSIEIRNPTATRPWQHVLDPLHGYLRLAAALAKDPKKFGGSWNFGPEAGSNYTVHEVAERVIKHWGSGQIETSRNSGPFEHKLLQLSIEKATHELGWKPRWHPERSIKETVHWYRSLYEGANAENISRAQIHAFEVTKNAG